MDQRNPPNDLTGQRFGRLIVQEIAPRHIYKPLSWRCVCDCGNIVYATTGSLTWHSKKSCGCLNDERRRQGKHGCSRVGKRTTEYILWKGIKQRCYCKTNSCFDRYGGRGITVCDRWRDSFENFLADMGKRPSPKHSLDRIDNDGPYSPENCRWATQIEQANNKRNNRMLTFQGRTQTVAQWSRELDFRPATILQRIKRGWPLDRLFCGFVQRSGITDNERWIAKQAKNAVNNAARAGRMPHISTQICVACGEPAKQYHHHKGYAKENWLTVVPVCMKCHNDPLAACHSPEVVNPGTQHSISPDR